MEAMIWGICIVVYICCVAMIVMRSTSEIEIKLDRIEKRIQCLFDLWSRGRK